MNRIDLHAVLKPLAEEVQVNLGEVLFFEGAPGDCFYDVVSGQLRVLAKGSDGQMQLLNAIRSQNPLPKEDVTESADRILITRKE